MTDWKVLEEVWEVIEGRKANPSADSYTSRLFRKGDDEIVKKLGEEAIEVIVAAKSGDKAEITWEAADLLYHLWVLLARWDVSPADVCAELRRRRAPKQ
jgi:phosphoribosyl-ATP pyrophosphohydrolase/phosphoribosyl-AMP cyclohydrolase